MEIDFGSCNLKHKVSEKIARPISGACREGEVIELQSSKRSGNVIDEERIMQLDGNISTSANRDLAGSPAVLNQLLYEGRVIEHLDKYKFDS